MEPKIPNPPNIRQAAEMALEVLEFYHLEHGTPSKKALDAISILRQALSNGDAVNISQERVDETWDHYSDLPNPSAYTEK
jgi:hypothetical protein